MLTKIEIENFKSIYKESIDLGRINVFIGENGCGKTNILEGLGMASATRGLRLKNDDLVQKGIRVTKPNITFSSFKNEKQKNEIEINCSFTENPPIRSILTSEEKNKINSNWRDWGLLAFGSKSNTLETLVELGDNKFDEDYIDLIIEKIREKNPNIKIENEKEKKELISILSAVGINYSKAEETNILSYKIYNLSTRILRGIGGTSHAIPGIHGENLDYLINSFSKEEMEELEHHASMISWLDEIIIDQEDTLKLQGHKLNLSQSKLYFRDKFMQKKNNVFSAENANEGILHILFYLALFISKKTPKLFAIDNIETALNPGLCRDLIEVLIKLAKKHDKQVLITTHNPAILDGINLHDDEQRIFTVARNFKGHTKVKRLQIKPDKKVGGHRLKLSELWMRNYLGAIPQHY